METDTDLCKPTPQPGVQDSAAALPRAAPNSAPSSPALAPPRPFRSPLPAGYMLRYFSPFCYSPRGVSPTASLSREFRDAVKRCHPVTLTECARATAAIAKLIAPDLLDLDLALVPVPGHLPPTILGPPTPSEAIAQALYRAGFGAIVWPALYRQTAVAKNAWSRPSSRPDFLEQFASLRLRDRAPPTHRFLLVDDFVARGRTLLASAAVLQRAFPRAHIQALPLIRTEGISSDIDAIAAPVTGVIRYVVGDAFRSP